MVCAGSIVIKGSTTVLPIAQKTAEAYMKQNPDVKISISGGGSGNGMKAL
ncbi:MAG: substrate-binding domain-containing protein, partial [Deltaproteobacteria bacterium]|nr:substrate-binding domain-containing protein [Deltaproteobacteria bacterium]